MKKIIKILGILMIVILTFGCTKQQKNDDSKTDCRNCESAALCTFNNRNLGDTILPTVKNNPDLITHLMDLYKYPKTAIKDGIEGKIFVKITIESNGDVRDMKIIRGLTNDCNNEALRVCRTLQWNPATVNGTPVKFVYILPIHLSLKHG